MQYYSGITGSDSSVHIIGYRSGKVDVYSPSGFYFTSWGVGSGSGDGQLYQAQGIARDEAGNFYIADTGNNRVQTFSPDGFYFKKWGIQGSGDGQFSSPRGIAVGPGSDPAVYVADTGNNRVQKFNKDGFFFQKWGVQGSGEGQFSNPQGIATDPSGYVYVVDTDNYRIQKLNASGEYVSQFGGEGTGDGQFQAPVRIAVDRLGEVYVTDASVSRVQKFTANGEYITQFGTPGFGDGQMMVPVGISVNSDGYVYVISLDSGKVGIWRPVGGFPTMTPTGAASPTFSPTPTPTASPTLTPSFSPTPTSTCTSTRTCTPAPTSTPTRTPSSTPTFTPAATPTPVPILYSWDFNENGNFQGWTTRNINDAKVENGSLSGMTATADPFVRLALDTPYDARYTTGLNIRLKADQQTKCQISVTFQQAGYQNLGDHTLPTAGEYSVITALFPQGLLANETILAIRVDPTVYQGGRFDIDYIRLISSGVPTPTQTPTATATPTATPTEIPIPEEIEVIQVGQSRDYKSAIDIKDPISAANGAYFFTEPLLSLGGPLDLRFEVTYRSDLDQVNEQVALPWSFWWSPFTTAQIESSPDGQVFAHFQIPNGNHLSFKSNGDNWDLMGVDPNQENSGFSIPYQMKSTQGYLYLMDPIGERVYIYQKMGTERTRIVQIADRDDCNLLFYYGTDVDLNPAQVTDLFGRGLDCTYTQLKGKKYLQSVTDLSGQRRFTFGYHEGESGEPLLTSITGPAGNSIRFEYNASGQIIRKILPEGNTPYSQIYAIKELNGRSAPRVTVQEDAEGNRTTIDYSPDADRVLVTHASGSQSEFQHYGSHDLPEWIRDPAGNTSEFTQYNSGGFAGLGTITDGLGRTTQIDYHSRRGKVQSVRNARGDNLSVEYDEQTHTFRNSRNGEQVSFATVGPHRIFYPDRSYEEFLYDMNGHVLYHVDRKGNRSDYEYNQYGQLVRATNPAGGVTEYTYGNHANLKSETDSDGVSMEYRFDLMNRLEAILHADGSSLQFARDLNSRVTSLTDEKGNVTRYEYDGNGKLTAIVDAASKRFQINYDSMDRIVSATDRLGHEMLYTYDNMERLRSITNGAGTAIHFGYDVNGMPNSVRRGDQTWTMTWDAEGNMLSSRSPSGNTESWVYDGLGYVTSYADPLGQTTQFFWDNMNRLTRTTDPLGHAVLYTYDRHGFLTSVAQAPIGSASFERDALGNVARIIDPNGEAWEFSHTAMGRLDTWKDPLGNTREIQYDNRGRIVCVLYPDGGQVTREYDMNDNLVKLTHSSGTTVSYSFNELNHLALTEDLAVTYDDEENVVDTVSSGVHFGATYDAADRLASVSYNNGTFTVNYQYDEKHGLPTRISDTLTGTTVDLRYDLDLRIVGIDRSNGVNAVFTYDKADRITRIQDGSTLDLQYRYDAAGRPISADLSAPLDPSAFFVSQTEIVTYDAASRVSSQGFVHDARGRLTTSPDYTLSWDGLSRLIAKDDIAFSYNGMRDLTSRSDGRTSIRYHYNYAIDLTPIVAEQNGAGESLRYYVWTPDGRLLYMIDTAHGNAVYFYHFDRAGSALALTNGTGSVTDAYAYAPYGELLAHQGENPQPFTFMGAYGVRQEGVDGKMYQMRSRYYDAQLGRFVSREPFWPVIGDPGQINPYQYALDNPIQMADITGTGPVSNSFHPSPSEESLLREGVDGERVLREMKAGGEMPTGRELATMHLRQLGYELSADDMWSGPAKPALQRIDPDGAVFEAMLAHEGRMESVAKHLAKTVEMRTTGDFISPLPKIGKFPKSPPVPARRFFLRITARFMAIRAGKEHWARALGVVKLGEEVEELKQEGPWVLVRAKDGTVGWLHNAAVVRQVVRRISREFNEAHGFRHNEVALSTNG